MTELDLMTKIISLCKRRGFVFQSSEIYGGLKSAYDFGPLGAELKRNIAAEWWRSVVHQREDIVGLDAAIMMHPKVWKASGHLAGFSDPLVDCHNCKERFRADRAPRAAPETNVTYKRRADGKEVTEQVRQAGYVCPQCGSPDLSEERQFNLMFRTSIGPIDTIEAIANELNNKSLNKFELRKKIEALIQESAIYLRPETAQAMFVQFQNVVQAMSPKIPFGIAQQGKAFRNEIVTEKFIFRTCEFEQMEIEYFVEPGTETAWLAYWTANRVAWWRKYMSNPQSIRLRRHEAKELAHYASDCYDVEYLYPWGWDELEGIASRTDYDLKSHSQESSVKLTYFDPQKPDPQSGKMGWRYTPYVIEPSAGLTRAVLVYLLDAYAEEEGVDADGKAKTRVILKLHPRLAPYKAAVFPLVKKDGLPEVARRIVSEFFKSGINARYDEQQSIGKRYARHDEIGTPYCLTIDHQTLEDRTVTIRYRDSTLQDRIKIDDALQTVKNHLEKA